ncbi:MAG TPA: GTP-binding protein HSR1, partial [Armatimonadota bacterium]
MPANLTPQYKEAEDRYKAAETHAEKLAALEDMLSIIPKHKGTEKIQADIKRRLAKLREGEEKKGAQSKRGV